MLHFCLIDKPDVQIGWFCYILSVERLLRAAAWSKVPSSGKTVVGHDGGYDGGFDVTTQVDCWIRSAHGILLSRGLRFCVTVCRPWWREPEIHHQDHWGQSVLFQRKEPSARRKGQCDNHRDQAGGGAGQGV